MPLARIRTRFPEEAAPVIERLRSQGYTVELLPIDAAFDDSAELELNLEVCSVEYALSRTAELTAKEPDVEVFVAPGALNLSTTYSPALAISRDTQNRPSLSSKVMRLLQMGQRELGTVVEFMRDKAGTFRQNLAVARDRAEIERGRKAELERLRQLESRRARAVALAMSAPQPVEKTPVKTEAQQHTVVSAATAVGDLQAAERITTPLTSPVSVRPQPVVNWRQGQWRIAAIAGSCLVLLIILGFAALINRRPASPLSSSVLMKSGSIQQQVPFGAVVLSPNINASHAIVVSAGSVPRNASPSKPKPSPAIQTKQTPRMGKSVPKPIAVRNRKNGQNYIADDEVIVRHLSVKKSKDSTGVAQNKTGVKRYSDLD